MKRISVEYEPEDLPIEIIDAKLKDVAGRKPVGSGFFFPTGTRDLEFEFETDDDAKMASTGFQSIGIELGIVVRVIEL